MKYNAVIFDLFGTLVDNYPYGEYQSVLARMALVLTIPFDTFQRLWFETAHERSLGIIRTIEANIEYICKKLRVNTDNAKIGLATKIRNGFIANVMKPRQDAINVISCLKSQGLKVGLISNCSAETTLIWESSPLAPLIDVAVFSCLEGAMKPEPDIYHIAFERLAVKAEECLYIADGIGQELASASNLGMHAVLIRVPNESDYDPYREEWDGPVISSLTEVLDLVK